MWGSLISLSNTKISRSIARGAFLFWLYRRPSFFSIGRRMSFFRSPADLSTSNFATAFRKSGPMVPNAGECQTDETSRTVALLLSLPIASTRFFSGSTFDPRPMKAICLSGFIFLIAFNFNAHGFGKSQGARFFDANAYFLRHWFAQTDC